MEDNQQLIQFVRQDEIFVVKLNRPSKRNALNHKMRQDLFKFFSKENQSKTVVILTGEGTAFCSGMDLKGSNFESGASDFIDLVKAIYNFPHPIIAAVNGAARGGGLMIVNACDLVVASIESTYGMPDVSASKEDVFTNTEIRNAINSRTTAYHDLKGKVLNAEEAMGYGFVNKIVSKDTLLESSIALANDIQLHKNQKIINYLNEKSTRPFNNEPRIKSAGFIRLLS